MSLIRQHHISFKNAISGIIWAFSTQPNFRIHLLLSFVAILLGIWLSISYLEMTVIIFTIIFGLSLEMINTSLEAITDLVTSEWRKEAKIAKDVSAGMMLFGAIGALVVGVLIFLPKLLNLL